MTKLPIDTTPVKGGGLHRFPCGFGFRVSNFFRVSSFVIRISDRAIRVDLCLPPPVTMAILMQE